MIRLRLLALAVLLVLLPLPLSALAAQAAGAPDEGAGAGMGARPHFVIEAGVRVPAATSASVASRLALPADQIGAPHPAASAQLSPLPRAPRAPGMRLALLGRLLLDGG